MADIFVSYAREDRDWVARFSQQLRESTSREIWWDRSILAGEQFDEAIQRALDVATCVVVVWSKSSVSSRWVKTEAREASRREILVPVTIENVTPPLEFRSVQTADLSAWRGELDHADFLELTEAVRAMIRKNAREPLDRSQSSLSTGPGNAPEIGEPMRRSEAQRHRSDGAQTPGRRLYYGAAATLAVVLVVVVGYVAGVIKKTPSTSNTLTQSNQAPPSGSIPTTLSSGLPHLAYGTWTLTRAIDEKGKDWGNSTLEFAHQEETADGLQVRGTFVWRSGLDVLGTEEVAGNYVAATRQLYLKGRSVTNKFLAVGSYSAEVSPDERTLIKGTWGSTALKDDAGVPGHWEAVR